MTRDYPIFIKENENKPRTLRAELPTKVVFEPLFKDPDYLDQLTTKEKNELSVLNPLCIDCHLCIDYHHWFIQPFEKYPDLAILYVSKNSFMLTVNVRTGKCVAYNFTIVLDRPIKTIYDDILMGS